MNYSALYQLDRIVEQADQLLETLDNNSIYAFTYDALHILIYLRYTIRRVLIDIVDIRNKLENKLMDGN